MNNLGPIGIFDSGIGGLTVLKAIQELLPHEAAIYLGDTARVPYGTKSRETIIRYSVNNARFLADNGVKMIVIACNTASAYALDELKSNFASPVVGVVEGGVKAAVDGSRGRIGVISTEATARSGVYAREIKKLAPDSQIIAKPCPLFVSLVEEGWTHNDVARAVVREYLGGMKGAIDTLVLACTHYPLLKDAIGEFLGPNVRLIDSARETAKIVKQKLDELGLNAPENAAGGIRFVVTDSPERSVEIGRRMLGALKIEHGEQTDIL